MDKQQTVKLIGLLSSIITLPFLYLIQYHFYKEFLGFKSKPFKFIFCTLIITIINLYTMKTAPEHIRMIIYNVVWLICICLLCKGNFFIKFYAFILIETSLLLINLTFLTFDFNIMPTIHNTNMSFKNHMFTYFIASTTSDLVRFGILFLFLKYMCSLLNIKEKSLNLYQNLYLLIPCLSIYSFSLVFFAIQRVKIDNRKYYLPYIFPKIYYIFPFITFALLISILINGYIFRKMLEVEDEQKKNMLIQQQFNLQLAHSKNIEGLYTGIRNVMHDMNNHLFCLRNLAGTTDSIEIIKYIDNLDQSIKRLDFQIRTGNPISDAVINEKLNIAKSEGIDFTCDFTMPKENILEPVDICVILSNTLDNAIEASMRINDINILKKICLKSYIKDMYFIIEVSNSTTDKLQYHNNKIISIKPNKQNHGIGISNIESAVKKYNGIIDIIEEKNRFIINLMLKIKK